MHEIRVSKRDIPWTYMLQTFMDVMFFNNELNIPLRDKNRDCAKVHG
jgi:hypothetical protein